MRRPRIKKSYFGFVPAYINHPLGQCAYYHCLAKRTDGRYCDSHALQYNAEAQDAGGAKVLEYARVQ
jgi:hypothetical protein